MRTEFKASGFEALQRKLAELPTAMSRRVQINALKVGAEPIRSMAATLAPRDEEAGPPHLADNIIIAVPKVARAEEAGLFDVAVVEVGPAAPFFWGYFQEIGTAFHAAQAFMRPAFDSQAGRSLRLAAAELWTVLKGFVSRGTSGRTA